MTDNDLLTTLHELLGGRKPWPKCVTINTNPRPWATDDFWCEYTWGCLDKVLIDPQHALDLVVAACERWLVHQIVGSEFWYKQIGRDNEWVYVSDNHPRKVYSLPDAIAYAMEQDNERTRKDQSS